MTALRDDGVMREMSGRMKTAPAICRTCPATLGPKNKSGYCRSCTARRNNNDPAIRARREAAQREFFARPGVKQALRERLKHTVANLPATEIARRIEHGRKMQRDALMRPEVIEHTKSPEVRARAGAARSLTCIAWCPVEWRATYRDLTKRGWRAPRARAEIERLIAVRLRMAMDVDAAATFLRRLSPVYRCDVSGRQNIGGSHWRRGSAVLDRDGLIVLALEKGWQPDAWARIAA